MKGRLGRIVVAFPKDAPCKETHVVIKKSPDDPRGIESFYGGSAHELLPGKYVVIINGKPVANVAVESKHDATLRTGGAQDYAAGNTHSSCSMPTARPSSLPTTATRNGACLSANTMCRSPAKARRWR